MIQKEDQLLTDSLNRISRYCQIIERKEHANIDICRMINDITVVFGVFYERSKQYRDKRSRPDQDELLSAMLDTLKAINNNILLFNESDLINAVPSLYKYKQSMVGNHIPSNGRFIKMPYFAYLAKMMDEANEELRTEGVITDDTLL
jgi:hypothetical protein